ncbi:hypothetical protein [Priestia megaterium]|uniref:hypothetical protein n=1 Tax=Priestia megaterium TaxID=1404 RepID=UPI003CC5ED10
MNFKYVLELLDKEYDFLRSEISQWRENYKHDLVDKEKVLKYLKELDFKLNSVDCALRILRKMKEKNDD